MAIHEINVTMLGPARVGKTSLLASMHAEMERVTLDIDLQIQPAESALTDQLRRTIESLRNAYRTPGMIPEQDAVKATEVEHERVRPDTIVDWWREKFGFAPLSSETVRRFPFNIGRRGQEPKMRLVLHDYPGELTDKAEYNAEIVRRLKQCAVTIIAVDTPALMTNVSLNEPFAWHCAANHPLAIHDLMAKAYTGLTSKRMVLLVPVKCEKWVRDPEGCRQLSERLRKGYEMLWSLLTSSSQRDNVVFAVTPVQTMGNIVFSSMQVCPPEGDGGSTQYRPTFLKLRATSAYEPKFCEEPLRYLLAFLFSRYLESPTLLERIFGADPAFRKAVARFSEDLKEQNNGFELIQGRHLLR